MESIDWSNLSFGYMPTDYNVRCIYKDGKWGDITVTSSQTFEIHMAATCLHYGQEAFEGMKAFRGKDGKIRIFRMDENAARLQSSCRGIMMPELPTEKFNEAILTVVKKNERFVPPYESGASLYIRPLLIGTSAQVGVKPAKEYLFIVFVSPGRSLFQRGFQTYPYGDTPSIRPRRSTRNRTLQSRRELRSQFSGWQKKPMNWDIPPYSIWTPKRKNISTNAARPTSSAFGETAISPRNRRPFSLQSPTKASCNLPRTWA